MDTNDMNIEKKVTYENVSGGAKFTIVDIQGTLTIAVEESTNSFRYFETKKLSNYIRLGMVRKCATYQRYPK